MARKITYAVALIVFTVALVAGADRVLSDNCGFINDSDMRNYCRGDCGFINDSDLRNMCRSDCGFINDSDLRNLCRSGKKLPVRKGK